MQRLVTIKDKPYESLLLKNRALVAGILVVLLSLALLARLFYLQVIAHSHFITLSESNRVKIVPIPPTRGLIYDRYGVLLAQNRPSFSLEVVPEAVQDMDATLEGLSEILHVREADRARFRRLVRRKPRFEGIPLRFHLTEEEVARFAVNRYRFPGVDIHARLTREYPLGGTGVHVVGYVARIDEQELQTLDPAGYAGTSHVGKLGVEKAYEDELHGRVGYEQVETNAQGRVLRVLQASDPVPGADLYLNIDASLQMAAEQALGAETGAVVAIEPSSGAVLALVSQPVYDPNLFVNGIETAFYQSLSTSSDRPLFNRALRGQYPPGSTVKPFMGLAGLDYGVRHVHDETWCPGFFRLPGKSHRYRDWKRGGHGHVDLDKAIYRSCDVYFYSLAMDLGIDRIHDFFARFGFGEKTGIDIPGELTGLMPSREWKRRVRHQVWYPGETLITGIGQGFLLATPLQLAAATATLAMRGRRIQPQVVRGLSDPTTGLYTEFPSLRLPAVRLRRAEYWQEVIDGMEHVVHGRRGTARRIGLDAPYRIAGKTGTAQVFGIGQEEKYDAKTLERQLRDHALFIAFAPVRAPRIAVAVIVEHGGGGSKAAAPIARRVMDHYLLGPNGPLAERSRAGDPAAPGPD